MNKQDKINQARDRIQQVYIKSELPYGGFDEILCYEIHSQPITPRLAIGKTGLTFKEIAQKWGISNSLLGDLIADHCKKL